MNAPVLLAQLSGSAPQIAASQKNLKLEKPQNGQAVTVHLDGQAKLDFSDIASEKLTFVRVGDKLIVLFDNQSTVTLEPAFDSNGHPLAGLTFEMAPDRTLSGDQFAELFPITTDQSVLPAAGGNGPTAGANFSTAHVTALGDAGNPLDLLGGENIGSGFNALNNQVPNPTPIIHPADTADINEDGLPGGNFSGAGAGVLRVTGSLHVDFGTDAFGRSFSFATDQPTLAGLTSDGQAVHLLVTTVGGLPTMIGYVGSDPGVVANQVFTVALDANSTNEGTYTFTLLRPLDHPILGTEDTLNLAINIIATDGSGDSAPTVIHVNVLDDTPAIVAANETHSTLVDPVPFTVATQTGSLGISWGADRFNDHVDGGVSATNGHTGDRAVVFSDVLVSATGDASTAIASLTSHGEVVHYALLNNGTVLLAYTGDVVPGLPGTGTGEGDHGPQTSPNIVFIVTLSDAGDAGSYVITQYQPLDHNSGAQTFASIDLSFHFTATDSDGDPVSGTLTATITDTVPTIGTITDHTVIESTQSAGSLPPVVPLFALAVRPVDDNGFIPASTGAVSLNIDWHADITNPTPGAALHDRSVAFTADTPDSLALLGLTSNGVTITYALSDDHQTLTASAGAHIVFTVQLSDGGNGSYTFTLSDNLDHAPVAGTNDQPLTFSFTATDSDGDTTAPASFTVHVTDDVPTAGKSDVETIAESTAPDNSFIPATTGGPLNIDWNSDDNNQIAGPGAHDRSVAFTADTLTALAGLGLSSNGILLVYTPSSDGQTLTATAGVGGPTVFTVQLSDASSGSYSFTLSDNLDHLGTNGSSIALSFGVRATDSDGDTVDQSFTVNVTDSTPNAGGPALQGLEEAAAAHTLSNIALGIVWGADDANGGPNGIDRSVQFAPLGGTDYVVGRDPSGQPTALFSNGVAIQFTTIDGVLVGYTGTTPTLLTAPGIVFTVSLSDDGTGSYSFDLRGPLDHSAPVNGAQFIDLVVFYTATDSDHDTSPPSTFTVRVDAAGSITGAAHDTIDYSTLSHDVVVDLSAHTAVGVDLGHDALGTTIVNAVGGSGNDTFTGGSEDNIFTGGTGNDTFNYTVGGGHDTIDGGTDTTGDILNVHGDANAQSLTLTATSATGFTIDTDGIAGAEITATSIEKVNIDLGGGTDALTIGGAGTDDFISLAGTAASFVVDGIGPTITVTGTESVIVDGNDGADVINAAALNLGAGSVTLDGGAGDDVIVGSAGNDTIRGGSGDDIIDYTIGNGHDIVDGGADSDTLNVHGDANAQSLTLTATSATGFTVDTDGVAGAEITASNVENVSIDQGNGYDRLTVNGLDSGETITLAGTAASFTVTGTNLPATTVSNDESVTIQGNGGDDTIDASALAIVDPGVSFTDGTGLTGTHGGVGPFGDSNVAYGAQTFVATGSLLSQLAFMMQPSAGPNAVDFHVMVVAWDPVNNHPIGGTPLYESGTLVDDTTGSLIKHFSVSPNIVLTPGQTYAWLFDSNVVTPGQNSAAFIRDFAPGSPQVAEPGAIFYANPSGGGRGSDFANGWTLFPGYEFAYQLNYEPQALAVTLDGGAGNDTIIGSAGSDNIIGGAGDDIITGGKGDDTISAGGGNDTINYTVGDGHDVVDGGTGTDTLNVTGSSADETYNINAITLNDGGTYLGVNIESGTGNNVAATATNYEIATKAVEEIVIATGGGADTVNISGDLNGTGVATSTFHIDLGAGNDTLDLSTRASAQRVVADGGGDTDTAKLDFNRADIAGGNAQMIFADDGTTLIGARLTHIVAGQIVIDEFRNFENFVFKDGTTVTLPGVFNAPPVIGSGPSGGEAENSAITNVVYQILATDPDHDPLTYSISGTDADKFDVSLTTGAVTFKASPNFEAPTDADGDNVYNIVVHANDGSVDTTRAVSITVTNVNEAPANMVPAAVSVNEDTTLAFTGANTISVHDQDGNLATTKLSVAHGTLHVDTSGGAVITAGAEDTATLTLLGTEAQINAALASLNYKGALNYNGADTLTVVSTDSAGTPLTDSDPVVITVNAVNDAPVMTVNSNYSFESNSFSGWQNFGSASLVAATRPGDGLKADQIAGGGSTSAATLEADLGLAPGTLLSMVTDMGVTKLGNGSATSTTVFMTAGQTVHFDWNFVGTDTYSNFLGVDDFAFFTATSTSAPTTTVKLSDLSAIGGGPGTTGWQTGSFTATADGYYTLGFGTINTQDNMSSPTLIIDNLTGVASSLPTQLALINENNVTSAGSTVAALLGTTVTDVDAGAVQGIAITGATGLNGNWQFSTNNGASWTSFSSYTASSALLLAATDLVRFQPDAKNGGTDTFTYVAWDQTSGTHGLTGNATVTGGTMAFSDQHDVAAITVQSVNDAPVLTGITPHLTTVQTANAGQTVASFLGSSVSDVDTGAVQGIAITGVTTSNGAWQYSINGGASWSSFGSVSGTNSLLLRATDLVRFAPNNANGGTDTLTYRAWDQSTGMAGSKTSTSTNGAATAFSTSTDTAGLTVLAGADHAPVLTPSSPTLASINEDQTNTAGSTVASLLGSSVTDADPLALKGIAITSASSASGTWQYSLDGLNWTDFANYSTTTALLLSPTDQVRFVPDTLNGSTDTFTFIAWDQTTGSHGNTANVTATGGSTAFSVASDTASITVTPVNDTPTLSTPPGSATAPQGAPVTITGVSVADVDAGTSPIQVTLAVAHGSLELASTAGLTFSDAVGSDGTLTFTGTQAAINAALAAGVIYTSTGGYLGSDALAVTVNDQGNTGAGGALSNSGSISISVVTPHHAPSGTDHAVTINEDGHYTFAAADFGFNDSGDAPADSFTGVTITTLSTSGALTDNGVAVSAGQTVSIVDINAGKLVFTPAANANGNGYGNFTFQVQDNGIAYALQNIDQSPNNFTINVAAVNDAPVIGYAGPTTPNGNVLINGGFETGTLANWNSTGALDIINFPSGRNSGTYAARYHTFGTEPETLSRTVATTAGQHYTLDFYVQHSAAITDPGDSFVASWNGAAVVSLTGAAAGNFNYTRYTVDVVATSSSTVLGFTFDDLKGYIWYLDDVTLTPAPNKVASVNEDTGLVFSTTNNNAIVISDVDVNETATPNNLMQATLSVLHGTLALSGLTGISVISGANGTASMTIQGTLSAIDAALNGLAYKGVQDYNGADTLSISTSDLGHSGSGGAQTDIASIAITVNAVNDAPVNTVPGAESVNQNAVLSFGSTISVHDVDGNLASTQLTVLNGTLHLGSLGGANISAGNNDSATLTLSGTEAQINAALATLTYHGAPNYHGSDTLTVFSTDSAGTPLTDSDTVAITVNGNHPPVAGDDAVATTEDTLVTFASTALTANDTDADSNSLTVTGVTNAQHGTVSLTNGTVLFTADANFSGIAGFDYTVDDGNNGTDSGHVTVDVAPVADDVSIGIGGAPVPGSGSAISYDPTQYQEGPSVAALTGGGYVVTWDGFLTPIQGRVVHADGTTVAFQVGADPNHPVNANHQIFGGNVAAMPDGSFAVTWGSSDYDGNYTYTHNIYVQQYSAQGVAGAASLVRSSPEFAENPSIAVLANHEGYVVTWSSQVYGHLNDADESPIGLETRGQRYDASGAKIGGEFQINTTVAYDQDQSSVAALNDGGFVVTWSSNNGDSDIYGQLYDRNGGAVGTEFRINGPSAGDQLHSTVTALAHGGFVVTWTGPDVSGTGIYGQRYDASGARIDGEFQINTYTDRDQKDSSVTALADGGFVVTWTSLGQGDSSSHVDGDVYGQRYDAVGHPVGGEYLINGFTDGNQVQGGQQHTIAQLTDGHLISVWQVDVDTTQGPVGQVVERSFTLAVGAEDTAIATPVTITLTDSDGSEHLTQVVLGGLPAGAYLNVGHADASNPTHWIIDNPTASDLSGLTLTPPANYNGTLTLTVTATTLDTALLSDGIHTNTHDTTATIAITVTPVNDPPAAVADSYAVSENTALNVLAATGVLANDTDIDSPHLNAILVDNPLHASSFKLNSDGSFSYQASANYIGADSFTYKANDGSADSGVVTVNLTVNAVNHAPVAVNDAASTDQGVTLTVNAAQGVLVNDTDPDAGDTLSVVAGTFATAHGGSIVFAADGSYSYVPATNFSGNDSVDYTVRDAAGATDTGTLAITVIAPGQNHAPVLSPFNPSLQPIIPGQDGSAGQQLFQLVGMTVTDADPGALHGLAITGATGVQGTWQFELNGTTTWTNFGSYSTASALLLAANDRVRFVSNANSFSTDTFTYLAWDQTSGTHGTTASVAATGGTTAFSIASDTAHLAVETLPPPALPTITEDQTNVAGTTVSTLLGGAGGLAVIDAATVDGVWQYSIDSGAHWANFGSYSSSSALLLAANDQVRFAPDGKNGGTDTFSYMAWNQTGTHGTTGNGGNGASAFATITVTDVNDAPVLAPIHPSLPQILPSQTNPAGVGVFTLTGGITDVDTHAILGIAIEGATSDHGTWQYSIAKGPWTNFGSYSATAALLLSPADQVRFVPDGSNNSTDTISYVAWDGTSGTDGATANASIGGGTTAFSTASDTATIIVGPINQAPVIHLTHALDIIATDIGPLAEQANVYTPNGAGGFTHTSFLTGLTPLFVALGDVNGDGKLDIASFGELNGSLEASVLQGNGAGGFAAATTTSVPGGTSGRPYYAAGDVSGDGRLDLVVGNGATGTLMLGTAAGGFIEVPMAFAATPAAVAIGDVTDDGKPDVVSVNTNNTISVLMGTGTGAFLPSATLAGVGTIAITDRVYVALGDVNGDGRLDIVAATSNNSITIWEGNSGGGYTSSVVTVSHSGSLSQTGITGIALGDINGDGHLDIVTVDAGGAAIGGIVSLLMGNGTGGFAANVDLVGGINNSPGPTGLPMLGTLDMVALGDVNGDGNVDIVVGADGQSLLTTLLSDGAGGFTGSRLNFVRSGPSALVVGDLAGPVPTTNEDTALFFGAAFHYHLSLSDADGGVTTETLTLAVGHGSLTLATEAGLSVTGDGTGAVSLTGTLSAINLALDGLSYLPSANYNGTDTLTVTADDHSGGANHIATSTTSIVVNPVNDAPTTFSETIITNAGPGGTVVVPDWAFNANDTDPDAGTTLSVAGVTFSGFAPSGTSHSGGNVNLHDDATAGGSLSYQAFDGIANGALVTDQVINNDAITTMLNGTSGDDIIISILGGATLNGNAGNDVLIGSGGNDILSGGLGNDTLKGGGGADVFKFGEQGPSNLDKILDFSNAESDTIDISALLGANAGVADSANIGNYIHFATSGNDLVLQVDRTGNSQFSADAGGHVGGNDVATLAGYGASNQHIVNVVFNNHDHQIAV